MQCALLATAQPGGAGSESSELSELSDKFAENAVRFGEGERLLFEKSALSPSP